MAGYADDLALSHVLADTADTIAMARFRALDLHVDAKPDLKVNLSADKTSVGAGDSIIYKVEVENSGAGQASGVVVTDKLPAGASVDKADIKASAGQVSLEGGTVDDLRRMDADPLQGYAPFVKHGVVVAVEAVEGTTEAIRRGGTLGGPGGVVVKAVARDHDYRFDAPAVGPETLRVAGEAGITAVAVEADRVLLLDGADALRVADAAGIAVVGVDGGA